MIPGYPAYFPTLRHAGYARLSINPTTIQLRRTPINLIRRFRLPRIPIIRRFRLPRMSINSIRQCRLPRMSTKSTAIQDTLHTPYQLYENPGCPAHLPTLRQCSLGLGDTTPAHRTTTRRLYYPRPARLTFNAPVPHCCQVPQSTSVSPAGATPPTSTTFIETPSA